MPRRCIDSHVSLCFRRLLPNCWHDLLRRTKPKVRNSQTHARFTFTWQCGKVREAVGYGNCYAFITFLHGKLKIKWFLSLRILIRPPVMILKRIIMLFFIFFLCGQECYLYIIRKWNENQTFSIPSWTSDGTRTSETYIWCVCIAKTGFFFFFSFAIRL